MATSLEDVIAAISTPVGNGGISIVRLSGNNCIDIANNVFQGGDLTKKDSHTLSFGKIINPLTNQVVDEVLISVMKGPKTYTKDDVVEINCHGGMQASQKVLETVLNQGARIAENGEFTKRAFLNGRIDLTQAEAVIDIINSKTDLGRQSAVNQLEGSLKKCVDNLRDGLLTSIATIEAAIDYPEHDIEEETKQSLKEKTAELIKETQTLLNSADKGKIIREGISTVILGKPNVGKSSLLNYLLDEERAIVTSVPGTTRDTVEEFINIEGMPIKIIDTAGIRHTDDEVEKIGVEKSKVFAEKADLILMMLDISRPLDEEDIEILEFIKNKKTLLLLNKTDLKPEMNMSQLYDIVDKEAVIEISAKEGQGIKEITKQVQEMFLGGQLQVNNDTMVTNVRHKNALFGAKANLEKALVTIESGMPIDFVSMDLMEAYEKYGEIIGASVSEDLVDRIFSSFCLGK